MQEKENVLAILQGAKEAVQKEDAIQLKNLSNQTVHTASITQDSDNIAVAVIVYSLSKIIERGYHGHPEWKKTIVSTLNNLISSIKKQDDKSFKSNLKLLKMTINKLSGSFRKYVQDVFTKASINKASKIHEHGISMERTAGLLGLTMFDLAGYTGQSVSAGVSLTKTIDTKSRIKLAIEMFG